MPSDLDDDVSRRIGELCARGDQLAEQREFEKAFGFYSDALKLVPEPIEEREATTRILASIGNLYFLDGNFERALMAFEDAVHCKGGVGNPFIHLRLGQCDFEMGKLDRAAEELERAYRGGGMELIGEEDPKYLEFLRGKIKIDGD